MHRMNRRVLLSAVCGFILLHTSALADDEEHQFAVRPYDNAYFGETDFTCSRRPVLFYYFLTSRRELDDQLPRIASLYSKYDHTQLCFLPIPLPSKTSQIMPLLADSMREHKLNFRLYKPWFIPNEFFIKNHQKRTIVIDRNHRFNYEGNGTANEFNQLEYVIHSVVNDGTEDSKVPLLDIPQDNNKDLGTDKDFFTAINKLIAENDFAGLDRMAIEYATTKARGPNGSWYLASFYRTIEYPGPVTGNTEEERIKKRIDWVNRWRTAMPASQAASIDLSNLWRSYAFEGRSGKPSKDLSEKQKQIFSERLETAAHYLDEVKSLGIRDPAYYVSLLYLASAQGWSREDARAAYEAGVAAFPDYTYINDAMAHYLSPRWNGDPGDWENLGKELAGRKSTNSAEQYSRYLLGIMGEKEFGRKGETMFTQFSFSWPLARQGFRDMLKRYPNSRRNKNFFALFACHAGDKATAQELFEKLNGDFTVEAWGNNVNFEHWHRWANEKAD